ncbi:hypothetical protein [Brachyspira hyodysenteriae]|uniref:hypothetical protein n=1 Tax=Brachyspira hyodysenteriae TaxID=159 RepID=UPI00063DAEE7|nr:hypothetical protein [Brachyspira hyodysenteriae]KLI53707.1 hypothetical protein SZ42_00410 [Brachyspira hyodysenteriae]
MKKIITISCLLIIALSGNLMAKTGFEVNVLFPFGLSLGTYTGTDASKYTKADAGFEFGIHVIPGYYLGISNIALGIGLDIGYQKDVFAFGLKGEKGRYGASFDSFNLGLLPRIDLAFISIGVGGGFKFPIAGLMYSKESSDSIGQASMYDTKTIYKEFNKPFIPYVKVTLDFILPLNLTAGIYVAYDIPFMESKTHDFKLSSVDLGAQIGIRF